MRKKRSIFLKDRQIVALTTNQKYLAVKPSGYSNGFNEVYAIDNFVPRLIAHRDSCKIYYTFGEAGFLGSLSNDWRDRDFFIFDEQLNPSDTLTESSGYRSIGNVTSTDQQHHILFPTSSNSEPGTRIINYDLQRKRADNLFRWRYFAEVIPLPKSDLFLLQGKTMEEYDETSEEQMKQWEKARKKGSYIDFLPQGGYWMIGNSKDHNIKKIGFEDYFVMVSSTGAFAVFYTNKDDEYSCKIISLNSLR